MPAKAALKKTSPKTSSKTAPASSSTRANMPSVSVLFSEALETFKRTALNLVGVWVVQGLISLAVIFAAVLAFAVIAVVSGVANPEVFTQLESNPSALMGIVGSLAAVGVVALGAIIVLFLYLGAAFQAAAITVLASKEKVEIGRAISTGFKSAWPLVLVSLITSFLVTGAFFLLLIPAVVVSIFVSMSLYEVILTKRRGMAAINSSVSIVGQNFWSILGRMALFVAASIIANLLVNAVIGGLSGQSSTAFLGMLLNIVWQFALTAYSLAFSFTLYQHAKAAAVEKPASTTWLWVTALLGYVLFGLLMVSVARAVPGWMRMLSESNRNSDSAKSEMMFNEGNWPGTNSELQQALDEVDPSTLTPEQQESMDALRQYIEALPE